MRTDTGLPLKKTLHVWLRYAKIICFIVMACDPKLHTIILWRVINLKFNIGKKITGLEIMILNREISSMFLNL